MSYKPTPAQRKVIALMRAQKLNILQQYPMGRGNIRYTYVCSESNKIFDASLFVNSLVFDSMRDNGVVIVKNTDYSGVTKRYYKLSDEFSSI